MTDHTGAPDFVEASTTETVEASALTTSITPTPTPPAKGWERILRDIWRWLSANIPDLPERISASLSGGEERKLSKTIWGFIRGLLWVVVRAVSLAVSIYVGGVLVVYGVLKLAHIGPVPVVVAIGLMGLPYWAILKSKAVQAKTPKFLVWVPYLLIIAIGVAEIYQSAIATGWSTGLFFVFTLAMMFPVCWFFAAIDGIQFKWPAFFAVWLGVATVGLFVQLYANTNYFSKGISQYKVCTEQYSEIFPQKETHCPHHGNQLVSLIPENSASQGVKPSQVDAARAAKIPNPIKWVGRLVALLPRPPVPAVAQIPDEWLETLVWEEDEIVSSKKKVELGQVVFFKNLTGDAFTPEGHYLSDWPDVPWHPTRVSEVVLHGTTAGAVLVVVKNK